MKTIVGLGNPGPKYRLSRHNLGFMIVEKLGQDNRIKIKQRRFNGLLGQGAIAGEEVILALPQTFMNSSGHAVLPLVRHKRIELFDLLIVCDDIHLPLGRVRLKAGGSDGGHKGLRSIIEALGSREFPRLRVGVSTESAQVASEDLSEYVLESFRKGEMKIVDKAVEKAAHCCRVWLSQGIQTAMNRCNRSDDE